MSPKFIFVYPAYNFRNNEIGAVIGLSQLRSLNKNNIEFRRGNAGGGNQLRQPYLKQFTKKINLDNFREVDHIHFFGYYIGNYPTLTTSKIKKICYILNSIKYVY